MKQYFVDSNVFLRFLIKDDEQKFKRCRRFFEDVETGEIKIIISSFILAEIVWVLRSFYQFQKQEILRALRAIISLKNLRIRDKSDMTMTLELFEQTNAKFIDCLIASDRDLQAKKCTLVSYDEDFDKLKLKREEP